jgi:hypothetical protein
LPARQPVRRKQRRTQRTVRQPSPRPVGATSAVAEAEPGEETSQAAATMPVREAPNGRASRQAPMSATRMALVARAAEMARLDVLYLGRDLRNIGVIAGLMLAIIIGLSFVLH